MNSFKLGILNKKINRESAISAIHILQYAIHEVLAIASNNLQL